MFQDGRDLGNKRTSSSLSFLSLTFSFSFPPFWLSGAYAAVAAAGIIISCQRSVGHTACLVRCVVMFVCSMNLHRGPMLLFDTVYERAIGKLTLFRPSSAGYRTRPRLVELNRLGLDYQWSGWRRWYTVQLGYKATAMLNKLASRTNEEDQHEHKPPSKPFPMP